MAGEQRNDAPDLVTVIRGRDGHEGEPHPILEVTGDNESENEAEARTARAIWVPAVNNHGGLGRWAFLEVADPRDAANAIRACQRH